MSTPIHFYHQKACNEGFLKLGNLYSKPEQVLSTNSQPHFGDTYTDPPFRDFQTGSDNDSLCEVQWISNCWVFLNGLLV